MQRTWLKETLLSFCTFISTEAQPILPSINKLYFYKVPSFCSALASVNGSCSVASLSKAINSAAALLNMKKVATGSGVNANAKAQKSILAFCTTKNADKDASGKGKSQQSILSFVNSNYRDASTKAQPSDNTMNVQTAVTGANVALGTVPATPPEKDSRLPASAVSPDPEDGCSAGSKQTATENTKAAPTAGTAEPLGVKEGDKSEEEVSVAKPKLKRLRRVGGSSAAKATREASPAKTGRGKKKRAVIEDSDDEDSQPGKPTADEAKGPRISEVPVEGTGNGAEEKVVLDWQKPGDGKTPLDTRAAAAEQRKDNKNSASRVEAAQEAITVPKPAKRLSAKKASAEAQPGAAPASAAQEKTEDEEMRDFSEASSGSVSMLSDGDESSDTSEVSSEGEGEREEVVEGGQIEGGAEKTVFSELGKKPKRQSVGKKSSSAKGKKGAAPGVGDGLATLAVTLTKYDPEAAATWETGKVCPSCSWRRQWTVSASSRYHASLRLRQR